VSIIKTALNGGNPKQEEGVDILKVERQYMQYIRMERREAILKPENKSIYHNITSSLKTNNKPNTGKIMQNKGKMWLSLISMAQEMKIDNLFAKS
jgi:hypothetical protein